jgi:hypothetical protein
VLSGVRTAIGTYEGRLKGLLFGDAKSLVGAIPKEPACGERG